MAAIEVDPVSGMFPRQGNDAGTVLSRRVATDVGKPPFITRATAVWEILGNPRLGGIAKPSDDNIQIVANRRGPRRRDFIEVNQGSPAPVRRA